MAFHRGGLECWLNTGTDPVALPEAEGACWVSDPRRREPGVLPGTASVWLRR